MLTLLLALALSPNWTRLGNHYPTPPAPIHHHHGPAR